MPTDEDLAKRAQGGDSSSFHELYRRYSPQLAGRLWRVFGRREDVHDALQQTFLQVHRALSRYDPTRPFGPWVHRISFRVAGTMLRGRRRRKWLSPWTAAIEGAAAREASAESRAIHNELVRHLYDAMESLPEKQRIAFALCELEGMGLAEAGELNGVSAQTMWARVQSARKALQKRLARRMESVRERGSEESVS